MDFGLSAEQRMLSESLGRHLADHVPLERLRAAADPGSTSADLVAGLAGLGVTALLIDEADGGLGLSLVDAALVAEALGRAAAPLPFIAPFVIAPLALRLCGSPAQRAEHLPAIAAGERLIGAALAEAVSPRDGAGVRATGGQLSGRSLFVMDSDASHYLVAAQEGGLFLVAADAPGLVITRLHTIDVTRRIAELNLVDAPAEPLPGANPQALARIIDAARVMLAADTLGAASHMLDAAVAYARTREQFGRPIGSFQAVKHMCAEMAASLEPCRALVWYAAHAQDAIPAEARLAAAHARAHVAEVGTAVARTATEVHGGMGFTDLLGLHFWFKRIGWNRQMLGGPEQVRREAAQFAGLD